MANPGFRDHAARSRYELDEGQGVVFADYRTAPDGVRALTHVQTPVDARGQGAAGRLMQAIVAAARAEGRKLYARCSYAVDWRARHPEAGDVLS